MLSVNSNGLASGIAFNLNRISNSLAETTERISTGKRINSAADDPAGMAISRKLQTELGSYRVVERNISNGRSLLEVSDTALTGVADTMQEMRKLAVQASDGNLTAEQRDAINETFVELKAQVEDIVDNASLFGKNLISSAAADVDIQVGINGGDSKTLTSAASDIATLGIDGSTVDTAANATTAIASLDTALDTISTNQAVIGAQTNALKVRGETVASYMKTIENANSRIEDVDLAKESANLQKLQTQQQLAVSMLGMASTLPQSALQLIR